MTSQRITDNFAVVACIDPDANGTGAVTSDIIDMRYHENVVFVVMAGTMESTATLDFKVQSGAIANMSDAADLAGKSITQLTEAGTDSDKQALIHVSAEETRAAGDRYLRGTLTIGVDACDSAVLALAECTRRVPASELDLASVDEIVT